MRLLSTKNLEVVSIREDEIPPYAILSHTWDKDEVTLQDMQGFGARLMSSASRINLRRARQGLQKVLDVAKLAASAGYDWIWIDTCCIDKTSSSELSEAINSMYRLYQEAETCYVYLADAKLGAIEPEDSDLSVIQLISESRWITRGWTLQELIAPRSVSFYSKEWAFIGKSVDEDILRPLAEATGIDIGVLSGDIATQEVSVANRMRWASTRKTTRQEDMAYCLMGLFGVNMPLLYGEGGVRAFIRLQNEVLQATDDQTIFAWSMPLSRKGQNLASGLLAESPAFFRDAPSMYPMSDWHQPESSTPLSMTNRGLMVQLYLQPSKSAANTEGDSGDDFLAVLNSSADVRRVDDRGREWIHEYSPAITLRRLWGDQFARLHADDRRYVRTHDRQAGEIRTLFVKQDQSFSLPSFAVAEPILRGTGSFIVAGVYPRDLWDSKSGIFRSGLSRQRCIQGLFRFCHPPGNDTSDALYDVAVALESTVSGLFKAVAILRPTGGRTVRQAYEYLNSIWVSASQLDKALLAYRYLDDMMASVQLRRTQRHGGVSYVVDLRERFELQNRLSDTPLDAAALISLAGLKVSGLRTGPVEQLKLLFKSICVSETSQPGRLILLDNRIRVRKRNKLLLESKDGEMPGNPTLDVCGSSAPKSLPA